jgi:predicted outer membrane repeat protein
LSISVSTVLGASDDNTVYVSPTGNDANIGSIDSPLKNITKAAELAPDHGVVFVKSGTYSDQGEIKLGDKNITVIGENPVTTIFDGSSNFLIDIPRPYSDSSTRVVVKGFTFQNIDNIAITAYGWCYYGSYEDGWGHLSQPHNISVEDCTFINNSCPIRAYAYGSNIRNCTFINNHASSDGGAVHVLGPSTISDCNFINNSVIETGWHVPGCTSYSGGAIYVNAFGVTINNCNFSGNSAEQYGDDIYHAVGTMWINNCLFDNQSNPSAKSVSQGDGSYHLVIDGVDRGIWA